MRPTRAAVGLAIVLCLGASAAPPAASAVDEVAAVVVLDSEAGDWVGDGQHFEFSGPSDAIVASYGLWYFSNVIAVSVSSADHWFELRFAAAEGAPTGVGTYEGAQRGGIYGWTTVPGIDVFGDHRGCNETYGSFEVRQLEFDPSTLEITLLDLVFEQHCEQPDAPALRGDIQIGALNALPEGTHDGFEGEAGPYSCAANGWAADPDDRYADLDIRVLVDGEVAATGVADLFRQDLLDAGVSPDGYSAFYISLWDVISHNVTHEVLAQAQDAQTDEWVDLYATPKSLTCLESAPTSPNPKLAYFTAECSESGIVFLESVFFANDNPRGGSTSAFHVVDSNTNAIVFTPGTDKQADEVCLIGWTGGWEPKDPWNQPFGAWVMWTPRNE